jgi:hypothetical protein
MPTYLVERYLPDTSLDDFRLAADRLHRSALAHPTTTTRLLCSVFLSSEETAMCLFEAEDRDAVAELNRTAGFAFDRIEPVDLIHWSAPSGPRS